MIRKQISRAREHSKKDLLEREKAETSIRNILPELHLLLAPNKEHKNVFPNIPVVGFRNGKFLKDYLAQAVLPRTNETGRCEPCGEKLV